MTILTGRHVRIFKMTMVKNINDVLFIRDASKLTALFNQKYNMCKF